MHHINILAMRMLMEDSHSLLLSELIATERGEERERFPNSSMQQYTQSATLAQRREWMERNVAASAEYQASHSHSMNQETGSENDGDIEDHSDENLEDSEKDENEKQNDSTEEEKQRQIEEELQRLDRLEQSLREREFRPFDSQKTIEPEKSTNIPSEKEVVEVDKEPAPSEVEKEITESSTKEENPQNTIIIHSEDQPIQQATQPQSHTEEEDVII